MSVSSRRAFLQSVAAVAALPSFARAQPAPRVVSLDYGLASTLLSLGVVPVAISELADWPRWVAAPAMPPHVVDLGSSLEINFEVLAQLKPDIILTTPFLDDISSQLSVFGKVSRYDVYSPDAGPILATSIDATRKLGSEIGRIEEAEAFLARADAFFDDCRKRLARISPRPLALVDFLDPRYVRIYGSSSLLGNVVDRIGLKNVWPGATNYWGFETIGIEDLARITDPAVMLVAVEPIPRDVLPTLKRSALWKALPFARPEHFAIIPATLLFGMVNEGLRFTSLLTDLAESRA